ncbi:hypothetical protein CPB83DRAFT_850684 [Crepidotus variabilis]|uniref:Transmembrane protein n=1 Tax=Crepidotus variabilis TaxID=179855 RepID=A0A9P6EKC8_9AGAR|nr:hypothetical protein CPB83DRAFT_850684 [Crepidotus variabilis]
MHVHVCKHLTTSVTGDRSPQRRFGQRRSAFLTFVIASFILDLTCWFWTVGCRFEGWEAGIQRV